MTGVYGAELSFAEAGDAKKRKWSAYGMTSLNRVFKSLRKCTRGLGCSCSILNSLVRGSVSHSIANGRYSSLLYRYAREDNSTLKLIHKS